LVLLRGTCNAFPAEKEHGVVVAQLTPAMERVIHDFSRNPLLVYWEMTQACGLACKHCRAAAMPHANPLELNTAESMSFLEQLVDFGDPLPHRRRPSPA
jgi:hypothetical protein